MKSSTSSKRAATLELYSFKSCRMAIVTEIEKNEYINNSTVKFDAATLSKLLYIQFKVKFVDNPDPENKYKKQKVTNYTDIIKEDSFKEACVKWIIKRAYKYYTSRMKISECVKAKNEEYKTI